MLLADMGAQVIRVSRPGTTMLSMAENEKLDFFNRGKRSITLNLKDPRAIELVLKLIEGADGLVEGMARCDGEARARPRISALHAIRAWSLAA